MLLAVEDGLSNGNFDFADAMFLIAAILAVIAAALYAAANRAVVDHNGTHVHRTPVSVWAPVVGWLAVACIAAGWFAL